MKYFVLLIAFAFMFISCGKKDNPNFKLEIQDVYAFELDNGWELNVNGKAIGFELNKVNGNYETNLSYEIDVVKQNGEVVKSIVKDDIKENSAEEIKDVQVEAQAQLDSTFELGNYKVILRLTDQISGSETESEKDFELGP